MEEILFIITYFLLFSALYLFVFAVASKFSKFKKQDRPKIERPKTLFMLPAYKEDAVILESVKALFKNPEKKAKDAVLVIADSLTKNTITLLKEMGCWVVVTKENPRSKSKAINKAFRALSLWKCNFQMVVLLDADNVMGAGSINQLKMAFASGKRVIQCRRVAKNFNTSMAKWDAVSEEVNNTIFRKGHARLGLSAALIGSGLGIEYNLFKNLIAKIEVFSGFDKQLELDLLAARERVYYLSNAFVYDEKVSTTAVFKTQRTRWIAAQVNFAQKNIIKATKELLFKGNIDFFNKYLQFIMPPRLLLLTSLGLMLLIQIITGSPYHLQLVSLLIAILSIAMAIPKYVWSQLSVKELRLIPAMVYGFLKAFFEINKARGRFLHTPHNHTS